MLRLKMKMTGPSIIKSPREYLRQKLQLPLIVFVHGIVQLFKAKTKSGADKLRTTIIQGIVVSVAVSFLVWLSILMYVSFYYAYVPTVSYEKPVHLQFNACEKEPGICSFPSAHVELTKRQQLLMMGQPYKMELQLEMPESPINKNLGMFMVCVDFKGKSRKLITRSCRSTMLHYRSATLDLIYTLVYSPFLILSSYEEKQQIVVELFEDYEEVENDAVTDIYVEIQSRNVEIYSAKFLINAHFSGLRHVLYHWPLFSAFIGISTNLFFIAVIVIISWYQLISSEEYKEYMQSKETKEDFNQYYDDESSTSTEGNASFLDSDIRDQPVEDMNGQD